MNTKDLNIYQPLAEKFYVQVPIDLDEKIIHEAIEAFFKFLDLPDNVKSHIDFTIAPNHRRGDVGFKSRNPEDDIYNDSKDFFHFHPALIAKYASFLKAHPTVNAFVLKAQPIWDLAYTTVHKVLSTFEEDFPGTIAKVFDAENVHIILRFLKYNWLESGEYLAKPHFDAGSFTLAIAESCPGLRIGSCPENLTLVEHTPGKATFMLSSNFKKVINSDDLCAGWHDVVQLDPTYIGKPFARWAIVAFIEADGVSALARAQTHKWSSLNAASTFS